MARIKDITFDEFDVGLDLRKSASVSDANRLRELTNAYVTTGKALRKRQGYTLVATLEAGTKGLVAGLGKLNTFYESGSITHANTLFQANKVAHPTLSQLVSKVHKGDVFAGYIYAAVEYADGSIWHHYLDGGTPTHVSDANCPQSKSFQKAASKIFAVDGEVVRFCATDDARDWTLIDDAGFLPTGRQQSGALDAQGLGDYQNDLAVFFKDGLQLWVVDPDPALHVLRKRIACSGSEYPGSVMDLSGELMYLSKAGYRSVSAVAKSDNLQEIDIGNPIDSLVTPLLTAGIRPIAGFYKTGGQYWDIIGSKAHVYTFSRSAKISAWSEYDLSHSFTDFAELDGVLYLRSGDDVYKLDSSVYADNGTPFEMRIEFPFLNFKRPGINKYIMGMDAVIEGSIDIQFRYDPSNPDLITDAMPLSGDTHNGKFIPVEITSTSIAPVITSTSASAVQLDLMKFYYRELGPK